MEKTIQCASDMVQKFLEKYLLAVGICRTGGALLYSFQIDRKINMNLISQFIAALAIFGQENLGKIDRVFIKGLDIEMSFVTKHDLIFTVLFRPGMVQDYLNEESEKGLDRFYSLFREPLEAKKTNMVLYEGFDPEMCLLIQQFLVRIGVLECVDCSLEIPILREPPREEKYKVSNSKINPYK